MSPSWKPISKVGEQETTLELSTAAGLECDRFQILRVHRKYYTSKRHFELHVNIVGSNEFCFVGANKLTETRFKQSIRVMEHNSLRPETRLEG